MPVQYLLNKKGGGTFKTTVVPSVDNNRVIKTSILIGDTIPVNYVETDEERTEFVNFFYNQVRLFSAGTNARECYDIGYYSDELMMNEYSKFLSIFPLSKYKFLILQNGTIIGICVSVNGTTNNIDYVCACPNSLNYSSAVGGEGTVPIVLATQGTTTAVVGQELIFTLCNDFDWNWDLNKYVYIDFKLSPTIGCLYQVVRSAIDKDERLLTLDFEYMLDNSRVNSIDSKVFPDTSISMTAEQWNGVCFTTLYDKFTKFYGNPNEPLPDDPYGEDSKPGGGGGIHDDTSDPILIPGLPSISASDSGFVTLFTPSQLEVRSLASYMWSGTLFDIDNFRKIFANPMDCILGFSIVPLTVTAQGTAPVKVGNLSTGLTFPVVANQYIEVDCGSVEVSEYWGAYMDYSPYTKVSIFLPFIGTLPIDDDEVMSRTVTVKYHVDLMSGACVAYVLVHGGGLNSVLYQYSGQLSSTVPITSDSYESIIRGAIDIATTLSSGTAKTASSVVGGLGSGHPISGALNGVSTMAQTLGSTANSVMSMKPDIRHSGTVSGSSAIMSMRKPYLIIERPRPCIPTSQNSYTGYPAYITSQLGSLTGMTVVDVIHLDNVIATEEELNMIESLLKGGVIL